MVKPTCTRTCADVRTRHFRCKSNPGGERKKDEGCSGEGENWGLGGGKGLELGDILAHESNQKAIEASEGEKKGDKQVNRPC